MPRNFQLLILFLVFALLLGSTIAQNSEPLNSTENQDPLDRLLAEFTAAAKSLDVKKGEQLFLPPDETPAGKIRQAHIAEMRKDWQRAKEQGAKEGPSVAFKRPQKILRAQMVVSAEGEEQTTNVEFIVAWTQKGRKIASMKTLPTN